jgi:hypothetical protein
MNIHVTVPEYGLMITIAFNSITNIKIQDSYNKWNALKYNIMFRNIYFMIWGSLCNILLSFDYD